MIGLDGVHKSLKAPVFFDATEKHDKLIRRECLESSVREHLTEPSAESIDLTLHARGKSNFHDLANVAAHILDSDIDVSASSRKLNVRVTRQGEVEAEVFNLRVVDANLVDLGSLLHV